MVVDVGSYRMFFVGGLECMHLASLGLSGVEGLAQAWPVFRPVQASWPFRRGISASSGPFGTQAFQAHSGIRASGIGSGFRRVADTRDTRALAWAFVDGTRDKRVLAWGVQE